jgi:hypothetical protein
MITIYGASDDLIEVEGDLTEEFGHYQEASALLACSDGTLLRIASDREGVWRLTRIAAGTATFTLTPGTDDRQHSDRVTLDGDVRWIVYADEGRDGRIVSVRRAGIQESETAR